MSQPSQLRALRLALFATLIAATAGCSNPIAMSPDTGQADAAPIQAPIQSSPSPAVSPTASSPTPPAQPDPYPQAINRASSAFNISRSAQSQDDWRLVASRWQQAIDLMQAVPATSSHHAEVQSKVAEYRRNLAYAQQQANRSTANPNAEGVVVITAPQSTAMAPAAPQPSYSAPTAPAVPSGDRVYRAPIIRRAGGTPVISVTFNGSQTFEMIVDTGASGTVITPGMAAALNVVPVAQASVDTASERSVTFPLGYVNSVEVGGAVAQNLLVAVATPNLSIGLLGHDFFGNYDVTVRQDVVEFRER